MAYCAESPRDWPALKPSETRCRLAVQGLDPCRSAYREVSCCQLNGFGFAEPEIRGFAQSRSVREPLVLDGAEIVESDESVADSSRLTRFFCIRSPIEEPQTNSAECNQVDSFPDSPSDRVSCNAKLRALHVNYFCQECRSPVVGSIIPCRLVPLRLSCDVSVLHSRSHAVKSLTWTLPWCSGPGLLSL